jgi:ParB/RepB/Spo0J family partition protein
MVMKSASKIPALPREVVQIPVDRIEPDPNQPRRDFRSEDEPESVRKSVEALAYSISEEGLHQPITVRPNGRNRFLVVMGERRWRAFVSLGLKTIPCLVREMEGEALELAQLSENLQRSDLTDLDVAAAMRRMLEKYPDLQKKDLAKTLNRSPSYISRMLAMVDGRFRDLVLDGVITFATVLEKYRALSAASQVRLVEKAKSKGSAITHNDIEEETSLARGSAVVPAAGLVGKAKTRFTDGGEDFTLNSRVLARGTLPPAPLRRQSSHARVSMPAYLRLRKLATLERPVAVEINISEDEIVAAIRALGISVPRDSARRLSTLLKALGE